MIKNTVIVYKKFWTIKIVRNNPNCLFVFGDNDIEYGKGGQAIIRDEPNTMGIPTKKYPDNKESSFYSDSEYDKNKLKINKALKKILKKLKNYECIVIPNNGFGTGLSQLPIKAPKTLEYLNKKLKKIIEFLQQDSSKNADFLQ